MNANRRVQVAIKRLIDIVVSAFGLVILSPLFLIVALAIKFDSKGPVYFRQERAGQYGKSLKVWKFRTMVEGAIYQGLAYTVAVDDPRITRVGRILRHWGLDELPQLINVLKREMSIVGPRPTLGYQVEHYDEFQRKRLSVKPGVTSLAVISGRNSLSWVERIRLDVWYIEHWSLWLDLKILLRTFWVVLVKREGLYGADGINDPFVEPPRPSEVSGEEHAR